MDPQIRLLLEVAFEAMEDAGVAVSSNRRIGSFAALMMQEYPEARELSEAHLPLAGSNGHYGLANRLSFALDLRGP